MTARVVVLLIVVFSLSGVMLWAAAWQYQRGEARNQAWRVAEQAMAQPPRPVAAEALPETAGRVHVELRGRFVTDHEVLLDNQTDGGRAGYHVWTPLRTDSGAWVIVDRGWIAAPVRRDQWPDWSTPTGPVRVTGRWAPLPEAGWSTPPVNDCRTMRPPVRLHYPDADTLACVLGTQPVAGRLLLAPGAEHGFLRDWQAVGMPPTRHYGYAVQWLGLTLALWILTWMYWRRRAS